ncbi:MAG TPA: hypothetical protein VEC06_19985 [Paucimonas sp.]|nr:hypothetical protein [Paucimonas sp.]
MSIHLHIERLVLDGLPFDARQEPLLRAALEAELARMLSNGLGSAPAAGATPAVAGGTVRFRSGDGAGELGTRIARALHEGIVR